MNETPTRDRKPITMIETIELPQPETQHLEEQYEKISDWLKNQSTLEQKLVVSHVSIFNVLVGLLPETFISREDVAGEIARVISQPPFKDKFLLLKLSSHDDSYSLINIDVARETIDKYKNQITSFKKIDLDKGVERFQASLISAFQNASANENEFMYGLLSGFPYSAVDSWSKTTDYPVRFEYSRFNPNKIVKKKLKGPLSYPFSLRSKTMPHAELSPYEHALDSNFPNFSVEGMPGLGFRLSDDDIKDQALKKLYARFNFIYFTLGGISDLKTIQDSALQVWKDSKSHDHPLSKIMNYFRGRDS